MPIARERLERARILVVDDEAAQLELLRRSLEPGGFERIESTSDPTGVPELCREENVDLMLLDVRMPGMDGYEVLEEVRSDVDEFPVLVLTADDSREAKCRAFERGANDFLAKPVSPMELRLRVEHHLERRFLEQDLQRQNERLEVRVRERTADLRAARIEILEKLAVSAEYRDDETGEHTRRVGRLAAEVARGLGLSDDTVQHLRRAAPLHDVGKIGVSDDVLLKPGRLTDEEMSAMKRHTVIGESILSGSQFPILQMAETIARSHHERWDGGGYPDGLSGSDIPHPARIVRVADVFDSLIHERTYKEAWPVERAAEYVSDGKGTEFDPDAAAALLSLDLDAVVAEGESLAPSRGSRRRASGG